MLDDIMVVQYSGIVSKADGNDTYILSPYTVAPDAEIIITDVQGLNTIQLIEGLHVTQSLVSNDSLKLYLSNGAEITVLDASAFTYELGGSPLLNEPGERLDFHAFTETKLRVTAPETGIVSGTPLVVKGDQTVPADDYVADTSTFGMLSLAEVASGTLESVGDQDWFKVDLVAGVFSVSISGNGSEHSIGDQPSLSLYDANGELVARLNLNAQDVDDNVSWQGRFDIEEVGDYFVEVDGTSIESNKLGNYLLHLSMLEELPDTVVELAQEQSVRVSSLVSTANDQTEHVQTLLSDGFLWSENVITYAYPDEILDEHMAFGEDTSQGWRALSINERAAFDEVVASQNKFLNGTLQQVSNAETADIRVAAVTQKSGVAAFAFLPSDGIGGDVFFESHLDDTDYADNFSARSTMAHELGHAMGLLHPFSGSPPMPLAFNNLYYTVMTYREMGDLRTVAEVQDSNIQLLTTDAYRSELGILDVAALQAQYGVNMTTNMGNTRYVYDESSRSFLGSDGYYLTIWDAGGVDLLNCSDAVYQCRIDLNDYSLSSISIRTSTQEAVEVASSAGLTLDSYSFISDYIDLLGDNAFLNENNLGIAKGAVIENVITGSAHDEIIDNFVDNSINAGAGDDVIYLGNGGYDFVNGGRGVDTVVLSVVQNSVQTFSDSSGLYLAHEDFAARLIGVELVQYSDGVYEL